MKVVAVREVRSDQSVLVHDFTVAGTSTYRLSAGVYVSNSKRISMLDVNALLSHGAVANLKDVGSVRGQENKEYWMQFMQGHTPRAPRVPAVYRKFVDTLRAAGVNVVQDGPRLNVMAMTNKDVMHLAGDREIKNPNTVRFDKELQPIAGGLFDPKLTGGHNGTQWSAIKLHTPMPNPVMEEPIRRLLDLTKKKYEDVISGDHDLGSHGTGPQAIGRALESIDVDKMMATTREQIRSGSGTVRDQAVRKLGYLKALKKTNMSPADWVLDRVPVLPPVFRPVSVMGGNGVPLVSDPNYMYKELLDANANLKTMEGRVGKDATGPERLALYHSFKALAGLGDPVHPKLQEKNVKGLLAHIFQNAPKFGQVQRKLLSSTVDNVGRAVAIPNPDYDMDTVGLPKDKAFEVYGKHVVRRMVRQGMPLTEALRNLKERSKLAEKTLLTEMEQRPVFINRAPVLHKFGILAFRPKLTAGSTIQVSPLICKGFNLDFDGDTMQFHVPAGEDAVKEAYDRLLPSRSLISPNDMKSPVHAPVEEDFLGALYHATRKPNEKEGKQRHRTFRNAADVKAAWLRGEIGARDAVHILEDN